MQAAAQFMLAHKVAAGANGAPLETGTITSHQIADEVVRCDELTWDDLVAQETSEVLRACMLATPGMANEQAPPLVTAEHGVPAGLSALPYSADAISGLWIKVCCLPLERLPALDRCHRRCPAKSPMVCRERCLCLCAVPFEQLRLCAGQAEVG